MFSQISFSQNTDLAKLGDTTATGSMTEVQEKNVHGHQVYSLAAAQFAGNSMKQFVHGSECEASCPLGCCDSGQPMLYEASMYSMLNFAANTQAAEHRSSAMQSCEAFNKLSSTQKNCKAEISPLSNFVPSPAWYDENGKCKSSAAPECKLMESMSVSPYITISKDCGAEKGKNCSKKYFEDYKLNPDGSMTMKTPNGFKKITLADFTDANLLVKLGMTQANAKLLTSKFKTQMDKLKISPTVAEKVLKPKVELESQAVNHTESSEGIPVSQFDRELDQMTRKPALTELTRSIDGDPIGSFADNIFDMIQRRYQAPQQQELLK